MGRKTKLRQAELEARAARAVAPLRHRRAPSPDPRDLAMDMAASAQGTAIRHRDDWPVPKTRDVGRLTLSAARHLYGRYRTPAHLDAAWFMDDRDRARRDMMRDWWMTVATGRSLWKVHAKDFLSRKEVHAFLSPPVDMSFTEALWYAVARSHTDDHGAALRVARSKIARNAVKVDPFRRECVRFFAGVGVGTNQVDDLWDYLADRNRRDPAYSLKGRSIASLVAATESWHRELARMKAVGGGSWEGDPHADFLHVSEGDNPARRATWRITQIRTGDELAREGTAMRHCVVSYKHTCLRGSCSIWSMTRADWSGEKRACTIEVSKGNVAQVRGLANRLPTEAEKHVVELWARRENLSWHRR